MLEIRQVQPSDKLFRWLHPGQFDWDENRPTSAAFRDEYMSVDIAPLTSLEESYERAKKARKNAVASIVAEQAFAEDQNVCHCPSQICEDSGENVCVTDQGCSAYKSDGETRNLVCINPAHGCVLGKKTKSVSRFFATQCQVELYPPEMS
jgi:hypothetical protein